MSDVVDAPGLYLDVPEAIYHGDRGTLSQSGAKKLLPPSCPAIFHYEREHPPAPKDVFDIGSAAHALVLGVGDPIARLDFDDWKTKAAREARDEARAEGKTPLLAKDYETVHAMAAALRKHPLAATLFADGRPEVSAFWTDAETGVGRRARFDWLPNADPRRRRVIPDYKTTSDANPSKFAKSAADFGYYMQAPWYLDAIAATEGDTEAAFLFVVQSKTPPYLVSVVELDHDALMLGHRLNRRALEIYAECESSGVWPGYGDDVHYVSLPSWVHYEKEELLRSV
ncbi:PD-(D/E)XK nuclease-like domain-containing protein [Rhodococcus sp. PD04]|uniref:PD-(D/E)XK nuclease-like domain-containing protein n=1 Tax=Rhodococcus sp. PD04 TaxID=3109594 RepID=UPI002DD8B104|nr:PD-(D/E)XK nuclease-like domain-containing protein [Rhodococcus sp. PD04]WSE22352.1 PD-(D/E)XK nuclease-like domain-containing protein [Rhodococcus sp. PD04]